MTKTRRPGTFEDAVTRIAAAFTAEGAGEIIGRTGSLIRHASDPDHDFTLNLHQALALDAAFVQAGHGEAPIYRVYHHRVLLLGRPAHNAADPTERLVDAMRELGELAGEVRIAAGDGRWTPGERSRVLAAIAEARAELDKMERDVEAIETGLRVARVGR
jgi:hypothetical protein